MMDPKQITEAAEKLLGELASVMERHSDRRIGVGDPRDTLTIQAIATQMLVREMVLVTVELLGCPHAEFSTMFVEQVAALLKDAGADAEPSSVH